MLNAVKHLARATTFYQLGLLPPARCFAAFSMTFFIIRQPSLALAPKSPTFAALLPGWAALPLLHPKNTQE
jgi:hypothetical protein